MTGLLCYSPAMLLAVWGVALVAGLPDTTLVRALFLLTLAVSVGMYIHGTREKLRAAKYRGSVDA